MSDERPSDDAWRATVQLSNHVNAARFGHPYAKVEHHLRRVADELGFDVVKRGDG